MIIKMFVIICLHFITVHDVCVKAIPEFRTYIDISIFSKRVLEKYSFFVVTRWCDLSEEKIMGWENACHMPECRASSSRWERWNTHELKCMSKQYLVMNDIITCINTMWMYRWKMKEFIVYTEDILICWNLVLLNIIYLYAGKRFWVLRVKATCVELTVNKRVSSEIQMNLRGIV
jgi:hypothetical protein